jgi:hypothetical protein
MPITESELKELRDLVIGLREEIRVGFANNETKMSELKSDLAGKIDRLEAKTDVKFAEFSAEIKSELKRVEGKTDVKFVELTGKIDVIDERTKLGFWGFVARAVIISTVGIAISLAVKYFFFGITKP